MAFWDSMIGGPGYAATQSVGAQMEDLKQGKTRSRYTNMTSDEFFDQYHPTYVAAYDPLTMAMADKVNKRLAGVNVEGRGLGRLRGEAMRRGPSTWARAAALQSHAEEGAVRDR